MNQRTVLTEDGLYEILAFLISSASLCVNEPRLYGSFRLIDGACRLIALCTEGGQLEHDRFLLRLRQEADEGKMLMNTDQTAYLQFLESALLAMAKEMKDRASLRA